MFWLSEINEGVDWEAIEAIFDDTKKLYYQLSSESD